MDIPEGFEEIFSALTQPPKDKEAEYWLRNKYPGIFTQKSNNKEDENTPQN